MSYSKIMKFLLGSNMISCRKTWNILESDNEGNRRQWEF